MAIVTLVSGGLDSSLMSLLAHEEGVALHPLFVDYGQLGAEREWSACQRIHAARGLPAVTRMNLSGFGEVVPSGITSRTMRVNEDAFLPGRNLLLVLAGAAHAYQRSASGVAIGLLNSEQHLFPDQTREFIDQATHVIETALGRRIPIITPLGAFTKRDVLSMARARGLMNTYSCHSGNEVPCGVCVSCREIQTAERS